MRRDRLPIAIKQAHLIKEKATQVLRSLDQPYLRSIAADGEFTRMAEAFRRRNVYCGDRLFENKYEFPEQVRQLRQHQLTG